MRFPLILLPLLASLLLGATGARGGVDPSLLPPPNVWQFLPLQRVHALLASSTRSHPEPVRVLIYGQSITRQEWWLGVASSLKRAYPEANLAVENRSIGAFDASYLIKTAEVDVYPFRPDLIIFHAYGPYGPGREWEQLLRQFRARTCADILLISNHPRLATELSEPTVPPLIPTPSEAWLNYVFSASLAQELGLCFPDTRSAWKSFLTASRQSPDTFLRDGWHFNLLGSEVQAAILEPYLSAPRVSPALDPFNSGRVSTHPVGTAALHWTAGRLRLEFVGNRVDAVAAAGPTRFGRVTIDGQSPTALRNGRKHGKVPPWRGEIYGWPALLRVQSSAPLLPEMWVLRITEVDPRNPANFRFRISGTRTGPDGEGSSTNRFVSKSGRVRIETDDWWLRFPPGVSQLGIDLVWTTIDDAVDNYFNFVDSSLPGGEITTLANDLPDGPHVLEIAAEHADLPPLLKALRVYHPAGSPWSVPGDKPQLHLLPLKGGVLAVWPADAAEHRLVWRSELRDPSVPLSEPARHFLGVKGVMTGTTDPWGFLSLEETTPVPSGDPDNVMNLPPVTETLTPP